MHTLSQPPGDRDEVQEKRRYVPTPPQMAVVRQLIDLHTSLKEKSHKGMSDGAFARLLGIGSPAQWSLIRSGQYFQTLADPVMKFVELSRALERYKSTYLYEQRFEDKTFVSNNVLDAIFSAVAECAEKTISNRKRIVVATGKTGLGKTMLAWQLRIRFGAIVVNANRAWQHNGFHALNQICKQMHTCVVQTNSRDRQENNVLHELQSKQYILVIDECEQLGKGILDSLKRFINESNVVVVMLAYPEAFTRWMKKFPRESEQIRTRMHGIYPLGPLIPEMAMSFMDRLEWIKPDHKPVCAEFITLQANLLGGLDLVDSTVNRLLEGKERVSEASFKSAVADEVARMTVREEKGCK
jgi:hypothetical protein